MTLLFVFGLAYGIYSISIFTYEWIEKLKSVQEEELRNQNKLENMLDHMATQLDTNVNIRKSSMRRLSSYNSNNSNMVTRVCSGIPTLNLPQNVARRFSAPRISLVDNRLILGKPQSSITTGVSRSAAINVPNSTTSNLPNSVTMNAPTRATETNNLNMSIRGIKAIHGNDVSEISSDEESSSTTDSIHSIHSVDSNHDTLGASDALEIPDAPNAPNAPNTFDTTSRNIAKIGKEKLEIVNSFDINTAEENNITNDNPNLKQLDANDRPTSEDTSRVIENSTKSIKGHHSTKFKSDRSSESRIGKKLSSKTKNANITSKSKSRKGRNTDSGQPNSVNSMTHDLSFLKLYESKPSHKSLNKLSNRSNENFDVYSSNDEDIDVKVVTRKPRSATQRRFFKKRKVKAKATHIRSKKKHHPKS
jgi:hypothetical protein